MKLAFILNREEVEGDWPPERTLLDFLREEAGLTAAKPGCREGDCGACAVLLGEPASGGGLAYRLVNSCLTPLAVLAGRHVLTVEGLGEAPNPVQTALAEEGGVQCGYCAPGMVVALTAHLLGSPALDRRHLLEALDGNLCRCTGYMGVKRAGERLNGRFTGLPHEPEARRKALAAAGVLPAWLDDMPDRLAGLRPPAPADEPGEGEAVLAGGTDLLLQHPGTLAGHIPWLADRRPELHGIELSAGKARIGAAVTMQALRASEELARALPELRRALGHVASTPVRDRATLGGNLVNASPIGDLSVMLLALGAELCLTRRHQERRLPLSEFYLGYKRLALAQGEFLAAVEFRLPSTGGFHFEKVAHRDHLDIASVNCALCLELAGRGVREIRLAAGGVAPVPLRLTGVEAFLAGKELTPELAVAAAREAATGASPISDLRGSSAYKRLLLRQLVLAGLLELAPFLDAAAVLETL